MDVIKEDFLLSFLFKFLYFSVFYGSCLWLIFCKI